MAGVAAAGEVTLRHQGLTLNAEFDAGSPNPESVVLITHGGLGHRGMELVGRLRELLRERGHASLAINLGLGLDDRHGMYDCKIPHRHRHADAAEEIGAWVDWLRRQGVKRVTLLGHSRGGAQTALYAAGRNDPLLHSVILLAPDTRESNDADAYRRRHGKALAPVLDRARELVRAGKGGTVLEHTDFLHCADTSVSADTFVSYYGPDPRLDTAHSIPGIRRPLLLVLAGEDEIVVNNAKFRSLADGARVQMRVIDGAGHFFLDLYADDAADAVLAFLRDVGHAAGGATGASSR
jgi:pimeloyl-ACP methyl ester carboxylesterase